jgi:hypothetical protein
MRNVYSIKDTAPYCTRCRYYRYQQARLKNVTDTISKWNIFTIPNLYPFLCHPQKIYIPRNTTYFNNSCHTIHCIQQSFFIILIHENFQIRWLNSTFPLTLRRPMQYLSPYCCLSYATTDHRSLSTDQTCYLYVTDHIYIYTVYRSESPMMNDGTKIVLPSNCDPPVLHTTMRTPW